MQYDRLTAPGFRAGAAEVLDPIKTEDAPEKEQSLLP